MDKTENYITEEKKASLEKELLDLQGPKRKEIIAALDYARSLGDLSENAEYHQAREDQGQLEERIKTIERILQSSVVLSDKQKPGDTISVGSVVSVKKEGSQKEISYTIVGAEEANMSLGKLSHKSPFGIALFGKKKGDKVVFDTPKGSVNYKILNVS